MNKILAICIILLFIGTTISPSAEASNINDGVEIKISAGRFGKDIGRNLRIDVMNNNDENVTIYRNLVKDYFIRVYLDRNLTRTNTVPSNGIFTLIWVQNRGLFHFFITVEGGNTKVKREGVSLLGLVILFK